MDRVREGAQSGNEPSGEQSRSSSADARAARDGRRKTTARKTDRSAADERADSGKADESGKAAKSAKAAGSGKGARSEKAAKAGKAADSGKAAKSGTGRKTSAGGTGRAARSRAAEDDAGRSEKPGKSRTPDKAAKAGTSGKAARSTKSAEAAAPGPATAADDAAPPGRRATVHRTPKTDRAERPHPAGESPDPPPAASAAGTSFDDVGSEPLGESPWIGDVPEPDTGGPASRASGRRTKSEPLRASWRPAPEGPASRDRERRSGLRGFAATYGPRVYLVPILLIVSVFVVVDNTRGVDALGNDPGTGRTATADKPAGGRSGPVAEEVPAEPIDVNIPTAELPAGGDYTKKGKGTWHTVPLSENAGERVGDSGTFYTYTVEVEDGIDPADHAGDHSFAAAVEDILSDPRSWVGTGDVSLQRVGAGHPNPDFRVSLTTPATTKRPEMCGAAIPYEASCYLGGAPDGPQVVINLARWVRGALAFNGDMVSYRQYAINHEVGHALNNGHEGCQKNGALAPVMMQQTFGVANDYVAKLNDRPGGDQGAVESNGKVCTPNGWPKPQAEKN